MNILGFAGSLSCNHKADEETESAMDNPLTDLPWLKTIVDELTLVSQDYQLNIAIYQCLYGDRQTGFLIVGRGDVSPFYNYNGELLCAMGGVAGDTCPELKIDHTKKILIWEIENGFINGVCEFVNPLEDLFWLKKIVEEFTAYSDLIAKRHFKIYQCSYMEEKNKKTGFIVTPICVDCGESTAMLYSCSGLKICNMSGTGVCDKYNIISQTLIWEINN